MEPLVSILIPAFNAQAWIGDTIRSAIQQTWAHKEIIVVNDGSSDQTLAIAKQFESDTVRIVSQSNQGGSAARNKAFSLSRGDYIQWLDNDDLLSPDKIARQIAALGQGSSERTLLSSSWGVFMYRPYRAKFVPTALWCDLSPAEFLLRKMGQNLFMQTATWLVSRQLTEAAGPWDTTMLTDDDGEYFCRVLLASDGIRFVPEAKVYFRISGPKRGSYMGRSARKRDAQWRSMQLHIGYLRSLEDSPRARAACVNYLQNWLIYFYPGNRDIVTQMEQLAGELDGQLQPPHLSWKYSWINVLFGWRFLESFQMLVRNMRCSSQRCWDKALFGLQNGGVGRSEQR